MLKQPTVNPKAQRIIRWRETLSTMNDDRFFEIMRIYLGEIKLPYNKDTLIEQLSSIFRKEQNKETILTYLSEFDIKLITAISSVKNCTQEKLTDFFKSEYSISQIYSEILNLTERLIIYTYFDSEIQKNVIALNPLLEETLSSVMNIRILLPEPVPAEHNFDSPFTMSPTFIAGFLSYIYENPSMCKNNASLKKRDMEKIEEIFPGKAKCIQFLLNAFINLGLVKLGEKDLTVDDAKFASFSNLSEIHQLAFLSVASAARLGRSGLQSQVQLLLDTIASIPQSGFSKSSALHSAFLISNKTEDITNTPVQGRFSRLIETHRQTSQDEYSGNMMDPIFDAALEFGLVNSTGKTERGENILIPGIVFQNQNNINQDKKGILNINAGTSIVILPGLSLKELLPLVQFMNIVSCNTVVEFEISRKSISRAFDKNLTTGDILAQLEKFSAYKIPQNLEMNIEEWHKSYSSAVLYKGYVLKVDEKTERIIENNPKIKPFINLKLAAGIFLLNIPSEMDVEEFISVSGIELMGSVKSAKNETDSVAFPLVRNGTNFLSGKNFSEVDYDFINANKLKTEELKKNLYRKLNQMELNPQQKEYLSTRIDRNIIITDNQLSPETVRLEILEADAMNYSGKCHLIDSAIKSEDLLEIVIPNEENPSKMDIFLTKPVLLTKQASDSILKVQMQNSPEETHIFSVSRINHLKIIRTSVFTH